MAVERQMVVLKGERPVASHPPLEVEGLLRLEWWAYESESRESALKTPLRARALERPPRRSVPLRP